MSDEQMPGCAAAAAVAQSYAEWRGKRRAAPVPVLPMAGQLAVDELWDALDETWEAWLRGCRPRWFPADE